MAALLLLCCQPGETSRACCQGDVEAYKPVELLRLAREQRSDGAFADPEAAPTVRLRRTALATLAFLSQGHSHCSKETYESINFGEVVQRGLNFLMECEEADRCCDSVLAAYALCEAYGITGSRKYAMAAQRAFDFVASRQRDDGRWEDAETTAWAILLMHSASELKGWRAVCDKVIAGTRPEPGDDRLDARVALLGAESYEEREAAMRELIGAGAAGPLRNALRSPDPEVAARAAAALEEIAIDDATAASQDLIVRLAGGIGEEERALGWGVACAAATREPQDIPFWFWASMAVHRLKGRERSPWERFAAARKARLAPRLEDFEQTCLRQLALARY
jgi:hypothetical protein